MQNQEINLTSIKHKYSNSEYLKYFVSGDYRYSQLLFITLNLYHLYIIQDKQLTVKI